MKKETKAHLKHIKLTQKVNSDANKLLRAQIFRLARSRDIFGLLFIIAVGVIIALLILLVKHW